MWGACLLCLPATLRLWEPAMHGRKTRYVLIKDWNLESGYTRAQRLACAVPSSSFPESRGVRRVAAVEARRAQPGWAHDEARGVVYDSAAAGKHSCRWPMRSTNTPLPARPPHGQWEPPNGYFRTQPYQGMHRGECVAAGPVPRFGSCSCGESVHN